MRRSSKQKYYYYPSYHKPWNTAAVPLLCPPYLPFTCLVAVFNTNWINLQANSLCDLQVQILDFTCFQPIEKYSPRVFVDGMRNMFSVHSKRKTMYYCINKRKRIWTDSVLEWLPGRWRSNCSYISRVHAAAVSKWQWMCFSRPWRGGGFEGFGGQLADKRGATDSPLFVFFFCNHASHFSWVTEIWWKIWIPYQARGSLRIALERNLEG